MTTDWKADWTAVDGAARSLLQAIDARQALGHRISDDDTLLTLVRDLLRRNVTVEDPGDLSVHTERLRVTALCSDASEGLPPMAEQYYLLALAALEQAQRYAKIADYHRMQGT